MFAKKNLDAAFFEWMLERSKFKVSSSHFFKDFKGFYFSVRKCCLKEIFRHEVYFFAHFHPNISEVFVCGDSCGTWDSPRSSRPDYSICILFCYAFRKSDIHFFYIRIFYVDGERFFICIFNFSFCKSCFTVRTPVNSFKAFVDIAFFRHFAEHFNFAHFEFWFKRKIWIVPFAKNAETDEIFALIIHIFKGILTTHIAKIKWVHFMTI